MHGDKLTKHSRNSHTSGGLLTVLCMCTVKVLAEAGVQHIVHWSAEQSGSRLIATHFGHAFAVALNNPAATIHEVCFPWREASCFCLVLSGTEC